jgi:hypothetical protein
MLCNTCVIVDSSSKLHRSTKVISFQWLRLPVSASWPNVRKTNELRGHFFDVRLVCGWAQLIEKDFSVHDQHTHACDGNKPDNSILTW